MTTRRTASLLVIVLSLSACSDDSGSPGDSGSPDRVLLGDLSHTDAPAGDGQPAAGNADGGAAPDTGTDLAVTEGPCAPGATPEVLVAEEMVACLTATAASNQCNAPSLCGAGWHLCTASEYQVHFASSAPPLSESCWLAGCVRDGGAAFAPVDHSCSACSGATGNDEEVGWGCIASITLVADELQVGLRASTSCSVVGVAASANEAYWQPWTTQQLLPGAVCCN